MQETARFLERIREGFALELSGDAQEAELVYLEALGATQLDVQSFNRLGAAALSEGDHRLAISLFHKGALLEPDDPTPHVNIATVSQIIGDQSEALRHCQAALDKISDKVFLYPRIAKTLLRLKLYPDAATVLERYLLFKPDDADGIFHLASAQMAADRLGDSEQNFKRALSLNENIPEAHNSLGLIAFKRGDSEAAKSHFLRAVQLRENFPEAYSNLADLTRRMGDVDQSEAYCRIALGLRPEFISAKLNLANTFKDRGSFGEAERLFREILQVEPNHSEALNNLGVTLFDMGRSAESIYMLNKAIASRPNYVDANLNMAISLLVAGRYREGWSRYEWRWEKDKNKASLARFTQPRWRGESLAGKTLLIHSEQGFGDTLQFCRYLRYLAPGNRIIFEVQPELHALLSSTLGALKIVRQGEELPHFDVQCPLLSLPGIFGTVISTIPASPPYLEADPKLAGRWAARLASIEGPKIGVVWRGNPSMELDRRRSIPYSTISKLFSIEGVNFISLQKGMDPPKEGVTGLKLLDWTPELTDFNQTAALAQNLDLIIGVDTAVIHLAGALGRPVWLLNRYDRCWRWLLDRSDSPWYPSLKQFRQEEPNGWDAVIDQVATALTETFDVMTAGDH